jgi:asparagine synthetase B (glutamine-hydrolysing)
VIVDTRARTVQFGRDYLGHFPLSYACEKGSLFISDDVRLIHAAMRRAGARCTIDEEALALYFSLGFVPHGMSPYRQVVNCEATGFYEWSNGNVRRVRLFQPVEIDTSATVAAVGEAIEAAVKRDTAADEVDVWCSGGLDSSIMAVRCNSNGRSAELLTLAYGEEIHEQLGDGERRFARGGGVVAGCHAARSRSLVRQVRAGPRGSLRRVTTLR